MAQDAMHKGMAVTQRKQLSQRFTDSRRIIPLLLVNEFAFKKLTDRYAIISTGKQMHSIYKLHYAKLHRKCSVCTQVLIYSIIY
jgi:hypothetical protein